MAGNAVSSTSISLTWNTPMESNGLITEYHIRCSGGDQVFNQTLIQTTAINSVDSYHTLTIPVVTAYTSVGKGPAVTNSVTTQQDSEYSISI